MLSVQGLSKRLSRQSVVNDVSFEINEAEVVGLVGPGGSGKSVLLKIIGGVLEPDKGMVGYPGDVKDVGFSFQEGALFDSMTVIDNVAFPLTNFGDKSKRIEYYNRAYEILAQVGLSKAIAKYPGQLSGGMRRRVGIARALVSQPRLVLLDEPTGGLDPVAASLIMKLIKDLHQHYRPTVVIVSHDIRRLLPNVSRVIAIFQGKVACDEYCSNLEDKASPQVLKFLKTRFDFSEFRPVH